MGVKSVPYLRRPANTRRESQQDTVVEFPREHVIFSARFHLLPQPGDPYIAVYNSRAQNMAAKTQIFMVKCCFLFWISRSEAVKPEQGKVPSSQTIFMAL